MEKQSRLSFLKDVFICTLGAYGGPEAHFGVFTNQLVDKRQYLTEEELAELVALTVLLPGPSSSQTIVAIGYKQGGPLLALMTMLVWALPVLIIMTILSFSSTILEALNLSEEGLRFIGPMALGFIMIALYRLGKKILISPISISLFIIAAFVSYFFRLPIVFISILILGGVVALGLSKEENLWHKVSLKPKWMYLVTLFVLAVGSYIFAAFNPYILLQLFEQFFRYGYLVIGGGQVLVPYMYQGLVEKLAYITHEQFVTGYGLVQGLPGPMFSFSAYAGGIAARSYGTTIQVAAAMISGIAIFLPGLLLIYFVYPMWEKLKDIKALKIALKGVTSVACGLIASTALILVQNTSFSWVAVAITLFTFTALMSKKIPAPLIVLIVLILGFII